MTDDGGKSRVSRVLRQASISAAQVAGFTGNVASGISGTARRSAFETGAKVTRIPAFMRDAAGQLQATPSRLARMVIPKCSVPMFLLPTGSRPEEFHCRFQFDEVLTQLRSGVLVRPVIQVWAGREDFDKGHVIEVIKEEFVGQFEAAKEKQRGMIEAEMATLIAQVKSGKQRASKDLTRNLGKTVSLLMLMPLGMFFDEIFLTMALFRGRAVVKAAVEYLSLARQGKTQRRQLERQLRELEARLDSKNEAFRRAVNALEVRIHPVLQDIVKLFYGADGVTFVPADVQQHADGAPDVRVHVHEADYLASMPRRYRSLLETF